MTMSMKKQEQQQLYGEYINPTIDQYPTKQENPLVLMAQACNNIGKELSSSSTMLVTSKQRKSNSSPEVKKSLKRTAPSTPSPPAKKISLQSSLPSQTSAPPLSSSTSSLLPPTNAQSFYFPPSPFMFDSLLLHHLSKTFTTSPFFPTPPFGHSSSSAFSPSSQRSPYFMDSILAPLKPSPQLPAFVCNWMESNNPDGFCGKRFANNLSLLEHLCTAHTSLSSFKSSYPTSIFSSYYSPTSVGKL
ncbi:unnamed protein product [Adineta ricciae]|uniref:C2H2-type domain-containing protein n=1 Tax=Adineta ricciae TaxID=249248 RepID=A0A814MPV0_ADIRI|nr:unnamed protein product [Adineta ricciae]